MKVKFREIVLKSLWNLTLYKTKLQYLLQQPPIYNKVNGNKQKSNVPLQGGVYKGFAKKFQVISIG